MWKRVVTYFVLTMIFTMTLGGLQQATGVAPMASIPQLGPALGAIVTLLIFRKDGAKLNFQWSSFNWQSLLITVLVPLGAALFVFLLSKAFRLTGQAQIPLTALAYIWIPLGAIGEEIGWRGYLHKTLARKTPGWFSVLIVGLLWAAFHVQMYRNGVVYLLFFFLLILSYTAVLYPLMIRTDFNILLAALFHTVINFSNLLYFNLLNDTRLMAINALVWLVAAGVVILRNKALFLPGQSIKP